MPRKARDVRGKLTGKFAFRAAKGKATDHEWLQLDVPGVPRIATKLSWGQAEIRDDILSLMAKQLRVSNRAFAEMIDCTFGADAYREHVIARAKSEGRYRP
jgi:hypothetical protein